MATSYTADERAFDRLCASLSAALAPDPVAPRPFVLFLGSGLDAALLDDLERRLLTADQMSADELARLGADERALRFAEAWRLHGIETCVSWYRASERQVYGSTGQPQPPAARQRALALGHLARLIARGVFDIVLTTDLSAALEDVLATQRLPRSDVHVWSTGRVTERDLRAALERPWPRVKILKLHGDLAECPSDLVAGDRHPWQALLTDLLAGRVLMLGLDPLRDRDIVAALSERDDGELFYVAPQRPGPALDVGRRLAQRQRCLCVTGSLAAFGTFAPRLATRLLDGPAAPAGHSPTPVPPGPGVNAAGRSSSDTLRADAGPLVELLPEPSAPPVTHVAPVTHAEFVELTRRATLRLSYDDRRLSFSITGSLDYVGAGRSLDLDVDDLNRMMLILGQDIVLYQQRPSLIENWRVRAKSEGLRLYKVLFEEQAELMQNLGRASAAVGDRREDLMLACQGPATHLGLPYELLQSAPNARPWVVSSALFRRVSEVNARRPGVADLLSQLRRAKQALRVLMVVPDAGRDPDADAEVRTLERLFKAQTAPHVIVDRLAQAQATSEGITRALRNGYHVLHYYGHGTHARANGEDSGLELRHNPREVMTTRHLNHALADSQVCLAFFNTCVGAMTAPASVLQGHDHLGTLEAVAQAGVPVVQGYRWWVRASSARRFAAEFYRALFTTHSAPLANLRARQAIYGDDANDETWLSPVLISQLD